ncbi:hypothetical protein TUM3792_24830 [Shewanella sp. MBTL60-007]|nr:hypothetical protein TUM3792_24830 [Shewanella sp. MBTL60-007]
MFAQSPISSMSIQQIELFVFTIGFSGGAIHLGVTSIVISLHLLLLTGCGFVLYAIVLSYLFSFSPAI